MRLEQRDRWPTRWAAAEGAMIGGLVGTATVATLLVVDVVMRNDGVEDYQVVGAVLAAGYGVCTGAVAGIVGGLAARVSGAQRPASVLFGGVAAGAVVAIAAVPVVILWEIGPIAPTAAALLGFGLAVWRLRHHVGTAGAMPKNRAA